VRRQLRNQRRFSGALRAVVPSVTIVDPGTVYAGVPVSVTVTATGPVDRVVLTEVGASEAWDDSSAPFAGDWTPSTSGTRTLHADGYAGAALVATDELEVEVAVLPLESCIQDGTIQLLYDAASGYVPEVGAVAANWTPRIGGTAADVLTAVLGEAPVYSASDVGFGGRPSITGNGVKGLQSIDKVNALLLAQPLQIILIGRNHVTAPGSIKRIFSGVHGSYRIFLDQNTAGNFELYGGAVANVGTAVVASELNIITVRCNTTASVFRKRNSAGAVFESGALNIGTMSIRGLTLFDDYLLSGFSPAFGVTEVMVVTGLSAADQARLDAWCQVAMGWT
jgi:hypothetical protein